MYLLFLLENYKEGFREVYWGKCCLEEQENIALQVEEQVKGRKGVPIENGRRGERERTSHSGRVFVGFVFGVYMAGAVRPG